MSQLDDIQRRRGGDKCAAHTDCYTADIAALLALVREQAAKLEALRNVALNFAERGAIIEDKFERNGNGSNSHLRNGGRGEGYREADRAIRAALEPTP